MKYSEDLLRLVPDNEASIRGSLIKLADRDFSFEGVSDITDPRAILTKAINELMELRQIAEALVGKIDIWNGVNIHEKAREFASNIGYSEPQTEDYIKALCFAASKKTSS